MSALRKLLPVAVLALAVGCSSSPSPAPAPSKSPPFTLSGVVTLVHGATDAQDGVSCTGWVGSGFGKVAGGAPVVVFGKYGVKVAEGTLGLGAAPAGYSIPCRFTVRVAGVPAGAGPYEVQVADQKMVSVPEAQARAGGFALSLG